MHGVDYQTSHRGAARAAVCSSQEHQTHKQTNNHTATYHAYTMTQQGTTERGTVGRTLSRVHPLEIERRTEERMTTERANTHTTCHRSQSNTEYTPAHLVDDDNAAIVGVPPESRRP